jgi:hypothetical protein
MAKDKNRQDEEMNGVLSVDELDRLKRGLDKLPETMPPRAVWHRIQEQARAEGLFSRPRSQHRVKWLLGAGIAAAVVLAVLRMPGGLNPDAGQQLADNEDFRSTPEFEEQINNAKALNTLMVQSQQLEQNLRAIPYQPRMVRASTAATISNLEDRIAAIDYQLNHPAIRMSPAEKQLYWRERVRLMDSLVRLRYAQAQRASF